MRQDALQRAKQLLKTAGIENPNLDARLLLQHSLNISHEELLRDPVASVSAQQKQNYFDLIARRAAHEPVSRIIGTREFWGLEFTVSPAVLDPRADSETLIEAALKYFSDRTQILRILDLGTGSGCLLITLLHEFQNASGIGVDQSAAALDIARRNKQLNNVNDRANWRHGSWWDAIASETFNLIVCNPPYIPTGDRLSLARDVAEYDPHSALFAGTDGLDCYRAILPDLASHLAPGGKAIFEIGIGQSDGITVLAVQNHLHVLEIVPDIGGIPRAVVMEPCTNS